MAKRSKIAVFILVLLLGLLLLLSSIEDNSLWVEERYARHFYRFYGYIPSYILGYIPFSFGDIFYVSVVIFLFYLGGQVLLTLWRKNWGKAFSTFLFAINLLLGLYIFFYISWGLNYYRKPISENASLKVDSLRLADYLMVLEEYLDTTNLLRGQVDPAQWNQKKDIIQKDLAKWVLKDSTFSSFLSNSQVRAKSPLSSTMVSYFGVSGYFNPFTHEAQVNSAMPVFSFPFTYVHELAHQQGLGFEDEANFVAFVRLQYHPQAFYRYSAYLQTTLYMLHELQGMYPDLAKSYHTRLSALVRADISEERLYWSRYTGWINELMGLFYNQYLTHNNQKEGMARYDRMTRLVLAYELKKRGCN
ncbi:DUF3810 domain-containing protein [Sphingobacterium sp. N143]|uniref:DUF3810 domain-containing protein n=1 Tax=Sphingobacterium sp. N143 TaxID=2746727 RepID=UPI0025750CEE|nr:DUF3810 domain-containing protein [Sphingobacterium sp. N143]MDM1292836.1 DUF3810 domain-containing protein [Sphingobacterium sp. N143]